MDVQDKRLFIRVAFNVPQDKKDPNIITTARIDAALPTVEGREAQHGAHYAGGRGEARKGREVDA